MSLPTLFPIFEPPFESAGSYAPGKPSAALVYSTMVDAGHSFGFVRGRKLADWVPSKRVYLHNRLAKPQHKILGRTFVRELHTRVSVVPVVVVKHCTPLEIGYPVVRFILILVVDHGHPIRVR